MNKVISFVVGVLMLLSLVGCDAQQLPQFSCPALPAPADQGPVASMNGQSSVDIELSRLYIFERVRSMLESPASAASGAFVRSLDLKELPGPNNKPLSVLEVRLEPWLQGQNGPASLQRSYRLTLKITPHISAGQGALLTFDLHELYNVSFSRQACETPDAIDVQIAPEIYKNIAAQKPLLLPTEAISSVIADASGSKTPPPLVDVNVSADGLLKIGLQYNAAGTHAFDRSTMLLSRYPGNDWVIDIDRSVLSALSRIKLLDQLKTLVPSATLTSFNATLSPGEIRVLGQADVALPGICGSSTTLSIDARSPTIVCKDAAGESFIMNQISEEHGTGNVCADLYDFWTNKVNIGTASTLEWKILQKVSFPAGGNETFYATQLDLDNAFAIIGRSSIMDAKAVADGAPRPEAPAKCPGVP